MLELRNIFLRKLALVFLVLFIVLGASLYFWIKDIYIEEAKQDLLHNISIFSVSKKELKAIDNYVKAIREDTGIRVTVISEDGSVLAESNRDKSTMDNHKHREEILAATHQNYGYAIRHSDTLNKELLYVAKKIKLSHKTCFVRMARDIDEIIEAFTAVSIKTALLFGLFALFAYWMILGIGSGIEKETRMILDYLDEMGSKERNHTISSGYSIEFQKITELLTQTSEKLSKRRKQKNKYTTKLKLANRQKDDIIAAISHEFKNPIAVISGYTQTLIDDKGIAPDISDRFLQKIHSNAYKLANMIDRLRLSIRLDENRQTLKMEECDIISLTQNAIESLQICYSNRQIILHTVDTCICQGDRTLLEIAIANLIENALKYSEDTPVIITIDQYAIKVVDEGIGIAPKEIDKITKKFYRVEGNNWNNSMGIGLSLVFNIAVMHDFAFHIKSTIGKGSSFEIHYH